MAGRRPKPTALKKLQGNPGGRPLNDSEPNAPVGMPEMPKALRPAARREWKSITQDLAAVGLISRVDGKALMAYCDAYADWEQAQRKCVADGIWYTKPIFGPEGIVIGSEPKEAPWFNTKCKALKTMRSFLIEFGLTPASRAKLHVEKPKPADEFPTRETAMADAPAPTDALLDSIDETKLVM